MKRNGGCDTWCAGVVLHCVERRRVGGLRVARQNDPTVASARRRPGGGSQRRRRRVRRPAQQRPAHHRCPGRPPRRPQAGDVARGAQQDEN